jgi:predicted dehydrogenase
VVSRGAPRVAVIGCGGIGTHGHLPAFHNAAQAGLCTLVGVADADPARAATTGRDFGVPAFGSVAALLETARPDAVSIATLPPSHRDLTLQALAAGCHVLCEKPVAMNAGEAAEMVAAAAQADRLLSVCFQYRYWDEAVFLRDRIAAGTLGRLHAVRTWGGAVHAFPSDPRRRLWAASGGGVLAHWTIHNLDLALWLLGHASGDAEPLTASAVCSQRRPLTGESPSASEVEDFATGMVRLAGGAVLTVEANWLQPPSSRPEGWELLGDRGAASLSPIRLWTDRQGVWTDETPAAGVLAPCDYGMDRLMAGFLRQVRSAGPSPVAGAEILRIQRLMDALYASGAAGREVVL